MKTALDVISSFGSRLKTTRVSTGRGIASMIISLAVGAVSLWLFISGMTTESITKLILQAMLGVLAPILLCWVFVPRENEDGGG